MLNLEGQASSDPDESWEANQIKSRPRGTRVCRKLVWMFLQEEPYC